MSEIAIELTVRHKEDLTDDQFSLLQRRVGGAITVNSDKQTMQFLFRRNGNAYIVLPQAIEHVVSAYHEAFPWNDFEFLKMIAKPSLKEG